MRTFVVLGLVLLAALAGAQTPADALRGAAKPLTVRELPEGFRAVTLGAEGGFNALGIYGFGMASGSNAADRGRSATLFALVGVTFVDPDEFADLLAGKRPRVRGYVLDFPGMVLASLGGTPMSRTPTPTFVETWIEAGRVLQWSPRPLLTRELMLRTFDDSPAARTASEETVGLSNVKGVATAMMIYASDYDDRFPKADSTARAKTIVRPYTKNDALWTSPNGGRVLYNTALPGVADTAIERPAETLLVWEERPYANGRRAVGFTDGHAKRLSAEEWTRLWAAELRRRQEAKADLLKRTRPAARHR